MSQQATEGVKLSGKIAIAEPGYVYEERALQPIDLQISPEAHDVLKSFAAQQKWLHGKVVIVVEL